MLRAGIAIAVLISFCVGIAHAQVIDSTPDRPEEQAPKKPAQEGWIRLDADDPTFNLWRKLRDTSKDPKREPGPIDVQRYDMAPAWSGIPTFFKLPVALTPEDLRAGKVDVAILGAPIETRCPVHILQGVADPDVPWQHAQRLFSLLAQDDAVLTLVKDGDHRLSRPGDIERLIDAIAGLV